MKVIVSRIKEFLKAFKNIFIPGENKETKK